MGCQWFQDCQVLPKKPFQPNKKAVVNKTAIPLKKLTKI